MEEVLTVKEVFSKNPLVSIVIPMYNAKKTLSQTIDSVFEQSYSDWEIIIVDDCSTDGSYEYFSKLYIDESRIQFFKLERNSGPGVATKFGVSKAHGGFVAFLDSDDLWESEKLKKQLDFMLVNDYAFSSTDYEQINESGQRINRIIRCKPKATYKNVLHTCPIGSSTVIITMQLLSQVEIPEIRKNNDYSLWLRLLKIYPSIYGLNEVLMRYRVWPQSISYNKLKKVKYFWLVYRKYEHFSCFRSFLLIAEWTIIKLLKIK